jgi:hypothetical protein
MINYPLSSKIKSGNEENRKKIVISGIKGFLLS